MEREKGRKKKENERERRRKERGKEKGSRKIVKVGTYKPLPPIVPNE